jgi:hypothetical protein
VLACEGVRGIRVGAALNDSNGIRQYISSRTATLHGRTRWIALFVLVLALSAAALHPHLAITVAAGCLLGLILALTAHSIVAVAIVSCPVMLLAWVASTRSWHSIDPSLGDAALGAVIGTLLSGAAVCSLIPYAAARWTGTGIFGSVLAWIAGLSITVAVVMTGSNYITISAEQLQHYQLWLTYNGILPGTTHFHYQGRVELDRCLGRPASNSYALIIPTEARNVVESFTKTPMPKSLRQWFSPEGGLLDTCTVAVTELQGGIVEVQKKCTAVARMLDFASRNPARYQAFDVEIPTIHLQAPLLIPGKGSILTVTAPRGCISDSYPAGARVSQDGRNEIYEIDVGFPRTEFSLFDADRMFLAPWVVQVHLMKTWARSGIWQTLARALLSWPGTVALFVLTIFATSAVLQGNLAPWRGTIVAAVGNSLRRIGTSFAGLGRISRAAIVAVMVVIAILLLMIVALWWIASMIDPSFGGIGPAFFAAIALIELLRLAGRWLYRRRHQ